jgi:hypothetical protein
MREKGRRCIDQGVQTHGRKCWSQTLFCPTLVLAKNNAVNKKIQLCGLAGRWKSATYLPGP